MLSITSGKRSGQNEYAHLGSVRFILMLVVGFVGRSVLLYATDSLVDYFLSSKCTAILYFSDRFKSNIFKNKKY